MYNASRLLIIPLLILFNLSACTTEPSTVPNQEVPDDTLTSKNSFVFTEPTISGSRFYIDPVNGSPNGDGSKEHPWRTLKEVFDNGLIEYYAHTENNNPDSPLKIVNEGSPVKGGDALILKSGYHGNIRTNTLMFNEWLHIIAAEGEEPVLSQIHLSGAIRKINIKGITILKDSYEPPPEATGDEQLYWKADAITRNGNSGIYVGSSSFWGNASDVIIQGCTIGTIKDAGNWSLNDWLEKKASGITLRSTSHVTMIHNTIVNVAMGIVMDYYSEYSTAVNNRIKYFAGDGMRITSSHSLLEGNIISDCIDIDENHDDGIQGWSRSPDKDGTGTGVVTDVTLRGNIIIGTTDWNNPFRGNPQGIGFFDGMFDNFTVENNIVITNHYHGISFYGMTNSTIRHNTVLDLIDNDKMSPWISVKPHKSGTPSTNVTVLNNIAASSIGTSGDSITSEGNLVIGKDNFNRYTSYFTNFLTGDVHILDNDSTRQYIIHKGVTIDSTKPTPTIGAYEFD